MLRYYMTPETRQSLIAESNRLIAMRAASQAARRQDGAAAAATFADVSGDDAGETDWSEAVSESAFARLVADLEATSHPPASEARPD